MNLDLQLGSSCKKPEIGDVYISDASDWPALGYFTLVFMEESSGKLKTIPLIFAQSLNQNEFKGKISTQEPPELIMPIANLKLK